MQNETTLNDTAPILEVVNVQKSFHKGDRQELLVLQDINFRMFEGEIVAILGKSGSGKSTLLRILAGLVQPTEGMVFYRGHSVSKPVRGISMVFQTFALLPWLTVLQNVELGLEAQGIGRDERRERALKAIDTIGLDGFETAFPKELSGGMRQRVGFARALVVNPDVLLMDDGFLEKMQDAYIKSPETQKEQIKRLCPESFLNGEFKPENIKKYFPNQLETGLTIHIFNEEKESKQASKKMDIPLRILFEEKVNVIFRAACAEFEDKVVNTDDYRKALHARQNQLLEHAREMSNSLVMFSKPENVEKELKELQRAAIANAYDVYQEHAPKEEKRKGGLLGGGSLFGSKTDEKLVTKEKSVPESFQKKIRKTASNLLSNTSSIATFDRATQSGAFMTAAKVTAHDRSFESTTAPNLSSVYAFKFDGSDIQVTTSYEKHASLVPIEEEFSERNHNKIILKTKDQAREVIRQMAMKLIHGTDLLDRKEPIAVSIGIDWFYNILTSNLKILDLDKQTETYSFIAEALEQLQKEEFIFKIKSNFNQDITIKIKTRPYLFNAGVAKVAESSYDDIVLNNNRKAYLHLSEKFFEEEIGDLIHIFAGYYQELSKYPEKNKEFETRETALTSSFAEFASELSKMNKALSLLNNEANKQGTMSISEFEKNMKKNIVNKKIEELKNNLQDKLERFLIVVNAIINDEYLQVHPGLHKELIDMRDKLLEQATMLNYKAEMDILYYSGKYKNPKIAPMLVADMTNLERLLGLLSSNGCKSANDRQFVAKLYIEGIALGKRGDELNAFIAKNFPHNSGFIATVYDTGGAPPKASASKFPALKASGLSASYDVCKDWGEKFATHKIKSETIPIEQYVKPADKPKISKSM